MTIYCLDTGVLIEPWNKHYSPELCPEYWEILDNLAKRGTVFCTYEVRRELEREDDELFKWAKARPHLFREVTDEVNSNMKLIMASHPQLVDDKRGRSLADPWVVAHAIAEKAIVVTTEMPAPKKIKIPDVCTKYGVSWIPEFQFAKNIGVRFSAKISP